MKVARKFSLIQNGALVDNSTNTLNLQQHQLGPKATKS
jgi:hypothetical protein